MWFNSFVNVICDGNEIYDELYSTNAVYFDVNWKGGLPSMEIDD